MCVLLGVLRFVLFVLPLIHSFEDLHLLHNYNDPGILSHPTHTTILFVQCDIEEVFNLKKNKNKKTLSSL